MTGGFEDPRNFSNGVPQNLHVLILSGYDYDTNEFIIIDPWTWTDGTYKHRVNYNKVNSLYEQIGKKAIIVR